MTENRRLDNDRFWKAVHAWCAGQLTDREFIEAQVQTVGFVWLNPAKP